MERSEIYERQRQKIKDGALNSGCLYLEGRKEEEEPLKEITEWQRKEKWQTKGRKNG